MYSTRGNKEGKEISLHIDLAIHCDKEIKELNDTVGQLFYVRLLEQEHAVYNIATDELIAQSVKDITAKIDSILIPFIEKLEGNLSNTNKNGLIMDSFQTKKVTKD